MLKKHAIQHGQKFFSVMKFFETYGGLTPSNCQFSMQSFVVLRCLAVKKRCLKVLKIQQRGDLRELFCSVKNLNYFWNHLIWWHISCTFHIWKRFCAAANGSLTVHYLTQVTFVLKKHAIQHGKRIFFCREIFWNLWRIDTLKLSNQYVKFHCPTLPCCQETLPQSFENSAKRGNFLLGSKF